MSSANYTRHPAPLTPDEYREHQKRQAEERRRRGLVTFTRPKQREDVLGKTAGESELSNAKRRGQRRSGY